MLSWLFKKRGKTDAATAPPPVTRPPPTRRAASSPAPTGSPAGEPRVDWPAQLRAAQGDDVALLRVATAAPALDVKLSAVQALVTEDALRQAEREFRNHDRKVHRIAKQRLESAVVQRESRAKAQTLLERATALLGESVVPVNHLVTLDRDWQAIASRGLEPGQLTRFAELRARLDAAMRERDESQQRLQRWMADAKQSLPEWRRVIAAAAEPGAVADLAPLGLAIQALRDRRPEVPATDELDQALAQTLQSAASVAEQSALLAAQAVVPPPSETAPAAPEPVRPPRPDAPTAEQRRLLDNLLQQAEAAIAEGQLSDTQRHLQAIDVALATMSTASLPDKLRARHQALWAERARLKSWQQWGGGRARDDLVAEAEQLARRTLAAAEADAPVAPGVAVAPDALDGPQVAEVPAAPDVPRTPAAPRLKLKAHADSIHALRKRWKELDRLGDAAGPDLWQRFDAALNTAHQPVAAQHAVLNAARRDNLAAREALLAALDAVSTPDAVASSVAPSMADWREPLRELDRFHLAWRKLGPAEHTVPADARSALQQRLGAAVDRIEVPLRQAQQSAAEQREALIARAEALLPRLGQRPVLPDATRQVRDLQAEWQDHARQLPLPRGLENALWARFKAATDAVFAQRELAFAARDTELAANLSACEALLDRLAAVGDETPVTDIARTLAEVDRAWRQGGELPRGALDAVESRYRSAHAAASQRLEADSRQRWQARCDALAARLALCEAREDGETRVGAAAADDLGPRWEAALGDLPAAWAQALAQRWARPVGSGPLAETAIDDLLLQLEAALDLPTTPESQAARRNLKLRALKEAMEGRANTKSGVAEPAEWWLAIVRQSGLSTVQRVRVRALVAALREARPGSLEIPR